MHELMWMSGGGVEIKAPIAGKRCRTTLSARNRYQRVEKPGCTARFYAPLSGFYDESAAGLYKPGAWLRHKRKVAEWSATLRAGNSEFRWRKEPNYAAATDCLDRRSHG